MGEDLVVAEHTRDDATAVGELDLPADLAELHALGPWLAEVLGAAGAADAVGSFELAVHEVAVNVVTHAYAGGPGRVHLRARCTPASIEVEVSDTATRVFDPADAPEPEPGVPQVHGYGLMIARQLVDELHHARNDGVNTWLLRSGR